ncbi:flavin reductase [Agrobacterium rhizogenes]|nr:flavin reductase [Rhizobium rhizogenes]NTH35973.1 flavin reductase [Rhizobium rhizogenes]
MAMMAAAVKIVTTDGPGGRAGLTVTAACSVSQEPPRLLVCVNTNASAHPVALKNGRLSLNILSDAHHDIASAFGGRLPPDKRFDLGEWLTDEFGQPLLEGACAHFSCSVHETLESGTHTIFVCNVHSARGNSNVRPLVYFDRTMMTLPQVA